MSAWYVIGWTIVTMWLLSKLGVFKPTKKKRKTRKKWRVWRIWAKALGQKEGNTDKEADIIAMIRTFIFLQLIITNCFIVGGNIRHWNDHYVRPQYELTEQ